MDYGRVFAKLGPQEQPCDFKITETGIEIQAERIEGFYAWSAEAIWVYERDISISAGPYGTILRVGLGPEVRFADLTASQLEKLIEPFRSILGSGLVDLGDQPQFPVGIQMSGDDAIRPLPPEEVDAECAEEWIRETNEPEVRNVGASKWLEGDWSVTIWAAEFVREEPLESLMNEALTEALKAVSGVIDVWREDREVWHVVGSPNGDDLTRAAGDVIDSLASEIRRHIED